MRNLAQSVGWGDSPFGDKQTNWVVAEWCPPASPNRDVSTSLSKTKWGKWIMKLTKSVKHKELSDRTLKSVVGKYFSIKSLSGGNWE